MDQDQNTPVNNPFPAAEGGDKNNANLMMIVAAVVLVALLALGWYMMQGDQETVEVPTQNGTQESALVAPEEDAATTALSTQGSSDELGAIEADLNATDMTSLNEADTL